MHIHVCEKKPFPFSALFIRIYLAIICLLICRTVANTKQSSKTFKQQRQEEKKASEASGNTRSWNTLFMRPDTVCTQSDIINWIPSFPWMLVLFCLLETVRLTGCLIMLLHVYIWVGMLIDFSGLLSTRNKTKFLKMLLGYHDKYAFLQSKLFLWNRERTTHPVIMCNHCKKSGRHQ